VLQLDTSLMHIRDFAQIPEWDSFVEAHPKGSILHTTNMIRCEQATKLHFPYAKGAIDAAGNLCALLVAVRIALFGSVGRKLTSRSIFFAEPIYLPTEAGLRGCSELIKQHDDFMSNKALFAEVRPLHASYPEDLLQNSGYKKQGYLNYELDIAYAEQELFSRLTSKCRNNLRNAHRKGVTIEQVDANHCIEEVYGLISNSYARSKVPLVDRSFFESAFRMLGENQLCVLMAKYQGVNVATGCFLAYKDRVICWYTGTLRLPGINATSSIFWEAIRKYSQAGYSLFDFAGAGWQGQQYGPGKFKAKFGGAQTNHGRYRKVYSPWMMKAAESVYQRFREFISPNTQD
jgi:serine/alanine adding enzyme